MIEFLNPLYLFGLSAAALPLLIHFFNKRKAKVEKISSIQFLKKIENKNIRNVKLKEYLLLLLRILIILLIVLSFSEPVVRTSADYSALSKNNSYYIFIDNTYSLKYIMGDGLQARQRVKNEVENLVTKFIKKGNVFLLFSDFNKINEIEVTKDDKWKEVLHQIRWEKSDFPMKNLSEILIKNIEEKKSINNYLFVMSDFQKHYNYDWLNAIPDNISTFFIPFDIVARKNIGIKDLKIKSKILAPNHKMRVELYLKNYSEKIDMETRFFLKINEKVVMQKNIQISNNNEQILPIEFLMENRGWNTGEIVLNSDEIEEDNHFYFSFYVPQEYDILVSSLNNLLFWKSVFKPLINQGGVNIHFINEKELMAQSFSNYNLLILNSGFNFSGNEMIKIGQFIKEGKKLLLIPEFPVSPSGLINFFQKFNIGDVEKIMTDNDSLSLLTVSDFKIDGFSKLPSDLLEEKVDFLKYFVVKENHKKHNKILQYINSWPFLIESGNTYAFTADISPGNSDFHIKALFLPFFYDIIFYLANSEVNFNNQFQVGSDKIWTLIKNKSKYSNVQIKDPHNKLYKINAGNMASIDNYREKTGLMSLPGFYHITVNENEKFPVAVNINYSESEWNCFNIADLKKFHIEDVISIDEIGEIENSLNPYWELWNYLLILAIGLLIMEMIISGNFIKSWRK